MRHMPGFHPFFGIISGLFCLALGLAVAVAITFAVMALFKKRGKGFGGRGGWGGPGGPGMPGGPGPRHHHGPRPPFEALRLLDERLARSEIDVDDYLARRSVLLGERPNGTEYRPSDDVGSSIPEPPRPMPGDPGPEPPSPPRVPTPPQPDLPTPGGPDVPPTPGPDIPTTPLPTGPFDGPTSPVPPGPFDGPAGAGRRLDPQD